MGDNFCERIDRAITDEKKAYADYDITEAMAVNKKDKSAIRKIKNDEGHHHLKELQRIKKERCSSS
jgi:rubrerythrin